MEDAGTGASAGQQAAWRAHLSALQRVLQCYRACFAAWAGGAWEGAARSGVWSGLLQHVQRVLAVALATPANVQRALADLLADHLAEASICRCVGCHEVFVFEQRSTVEQAAG